MVGINLLREGLDLPEVSLVAILDADKEGFLRSSTSLIQTIGRAARNVSGEVHMYADTVTKSMQQAIDETNRRRAKQIEYNTLHNIDPTPLRKRIGDITELLARESFDTETLLSEKSVRSTKPDSTTRAGADKIAVEGADALRSLIEELDAQMHSAAEELKFELAARLRDEIADMKKQLRAMQAAGHA